jgi:hypothetical protein
MSTFNISQKRCYLPFAVFSHSIFRIHAFQLNRKLEKNLSIRIMICPHPGCDQQARFDCELCTLRVCHDCVEDARRRRNHFDNNLLPKGVKCGCSHDDHDRNQPHHFQALGGERRKSFM